MFVLIDKMNMYGNTKGDEGYKEFEVNITDITFNNPFTINLPTSSIFKPPVDKYNNKKFTIKQLTYQKNFQDDNNGTVYTSIFGFNNPIKLVALDVGNGENWTITKAPSSLMAILYPQQVLTYQQKISNQIDPGISFVLRYTLLDEIDFLITNNVFTMKFALQDMNGGTIALSNGTSPETPEFIFLKCLISEQ